MPVLRGAPHETKQKDKLGIGGRRPVSDATESYGIVRCPVATYPKTKAARPVVASSWAVDPRTSWDDASVRQQKRQGLVARKPLSYCGAVRYID